jgi:hypothetical protein
VRDARGEQPLWYRETHNCSSPGERQHQCVLQKFLFEAFDEFFVVRRTFDILRKMLAMFDEVDSPPFANDEEDVILRFTCFGTDYSSDRLYPMSQEMRAM